MKGLYEVSIELEDRLRRLEDRAEISERVINFAKALDGRDWGAYADCFTDVVHVDFSEAGLPARRFAREELADFARQALGGFATTQHLSPNHVIRFDDSDPDRAVCFSYMYAQHHLPGSEKGDFYLMRGSYENRMLRTERGWKIEGVVQHVTWAEGNPDAPAEAAVRLQEAGRSGSR